MFNQFKRFSIPRPLFFMDGNDAGGGTDTSKQTDNAQDKSVKTFTQEDVNAIAGEARADGRKKFEADILAKLGLKSVDEIAEVIKTAKEFEDGKKSELEKLTSRVEKSEQLLEAEKAEREKERTGFTNKLIDMEIRQAASKVVTDEKAKKVRPAFRQAALDDVLLLIDRSKIKQDDDGKIVGVEKALEELASKKDYLLDVALPPKKGTPENGGRRQDPIEQTKTPRPSTL